jgi:hypothetical protein
MPILLHQNYYGNLSNDMNNQYLSKQYIVNKIQSNSRVFNDNQYLKSLTSNAYNNPIDAKSLKDLVDNVKGLYKKNIELMIKLKNYFITNVPAGMPAPPPPAALPPVPFTIPPPPPPPPPPPSSFSASMPPSTPIAPPPPPAAAGPVFGPAPAPPPVAHPLSGIGTYLGLWGRPAGAGRGGRGGRGSKRGGKVALIEKYGVGIDITTLIDNIQNNINLIKIDLLKLLSYQRFITPTSVYEINELHKQFFNYFNENIVPYSLSHIYPPITSLIGIPFNDIIDKLNELYINYNNEFNRFIIPKLNNTL